MENNELDRVCGYCGLPILNENKPLEVYKHFFHSNFDCFSNYTIVLGIYNWVETHRDFIHPDFKDIDFHSIKINEFLPIYRERLIKQKEKPVEKTIQTSVAD